MSKEDNLWSMIKLGLILAAYAVASCAILAVVNNATSPVIQQNQIKKANEAMKSVFVDAENFEQINDYEKAQNSSISIDNMYLAKKGTETIGAACQISGPTYDQGTIIIGMTKDGILTGLRFLKLTDSPGFGLKANDPTFTLPNGMTFYEQFSGKDVKNGFTAGENFDAISGATITSVGIANLINEGTASMIKYFAKNGGNNE